MTKHDFTETALKPLRTGFFRDELRPTELSYFYKEVAPEDIADFYAASYAYHAHTAENENRRNGGVREQVDTIDTLERTIGTIREAGCGALVNEILRASVYMSDDFELTIPELPQEVRSNLELFDVCDLDQDLEEVTKRDFPLDYVMAVQKLLLLKNNGIVDSNEILSQVAQIARDLFIARSRSLAEVIERGSMTKTTYERAIAKPWADVAMYICDTFRPSVPGQIHAVDSLLHSAHMNGSILEHLTGDPAAALGILDAKDTAVDNIDEIANRGGRAARQILRSLKLPQKQGD